MIFDVFEDLRIALAIFQRNPGVIEKTVVFVSGV